MVVMMMVVVVLLATRLYFCALTQILKKFLPAHPKIQSGFTSPYSNTPASHTLQVVVSPGLGGRREGACGVGAWNVGRTKVAFAAGPSVEGSGAEDWGGSGRGSLPTALLPLQTGRATV